MRDFQPTFAVVPAVGTRLELLSVGKTDEPLAHSYRRATDALYTLVCAIVPFRATGSNQIGGLTRREIARQYDAGGRPDVALTPRTRAELQGQDIVVIDDGLASGATLAQILTSVCEAGARRVWAIAVCCRAPLREAQYWEAVRSMHGVNCTVPVKVSIPVFFPVPFHSAKGCPVERAMASVDRFADSHDAIATVAQQIKREMRVEDWELADSTWSTSYTRARLRCHTFAELADRDRWAREQLEALLAIITASLAATPVLTADNADSVRAVLEVFVDEPELLTRARLRKTIEPLIRTIARTVLRNRDAAIPLRRAALVVVRAGLHVEFERALDQSLLNDIADSAELLERLAFQLYTLVRQGRIPASALRAAHGVLELADRIAAVDPSNEAAGRASQIALTTTLIPVAHQGNGDVVSDILEAKSRLLTRQTEDHSIENALGLLMGGEDGRLHKPELFLKLAGAIKDLHSVMLGRALPALSVLNGQFRATPSTTPLEGYVTGVEAYLASVTDERDGALPGDVRTLVYWCSETGRPVPTMMRAPIAQAARRIRMALFAGSNSAAAVVLTSWLSITVGMLIDDLYDQVHLVVSSFPHAHIDVRVNLPRNTVIVGPFSLYAQIFRLWADNLNKAFPLGDVDEPVVEIVAEYSGLPHNSRNVRIVLADNGRGLEAAYRTSSTTIHQRERCEFFGRLLPARNRPDGQGCIATLELREVRL